MKEIPFDTHQLVDPAKAYRKDTLGIDMWGPKEIASLPEGHEIICGLSFGYEDKCAKINEVTMDRAPLDSMLTLIK